MHAQLSSGPRYKNLESEPLSTTKQMLWPDCEGVRLV